MATLTTQTLTIGDDVTPNYQTCSAADKFTATGGRYILHYKNGAGGAVTTIWAKNTAAAPTGTFPANAAGAADPFDLRLSNGIAISTEGITVIPDASVYADATQFVNLVHNGVAGPLTVAIYGPLP
jgi:hypothetical protein